MRSKHLVYAMRDPRIQLSTQILLFGYSQYAKIIIQKSNAPLLFPLDQNPKFYVIIQNHYNNDIQMGPKMCTSSSYLRKKGFEYKNISPIHNLGIILNASSPILQNRWIFIKSSTTTIHTKPFYQKIYNLYQLNRVVIYSMSSS